MVLSGGTSASSEVPSDLRGNADLFRALLEGGPEWRRRVIHRLEFESGQHVRVLSSYQCELPRSAVVDDVGTTDEHGSAITGPDAVRLLLPLTTRSKAPLLNFDAVGPIDPPHLLPRGEIAVLQAAVLESVARDSVAASVVPLAFPNDLLQAICVFSPAVFKSFSDQRRSKAAALRDYLAGGLHLDVATSEVTDWLAVALLAGYDLPSYLGEPPDRTFVNASRGEDLFSSSECVLLALPKLEHKPRSVPEVGALVEKYAKGIAAMKSAARENDPFAEAFLAMLAEYGRRWQVVLDLEVPLDAPITIKLSDDRPLGLGMTGRTRRQLAFNEGASVHVEARSLDPAVRLHRKLEILAPSSLPLGIGPTRGFGGDVGPLELVRSTPEVHSVYSSVAERPKIVDFGVRLLPARDIRWPVYAALLLTIGAAVIAASLNGGRDLVDALAVLVVPTTFAATVALIRERTTLATRLQQAWNLGLGAAVVALWVIAGAQLVEHAT